MTSSRAMFIALAISLCGTAVADQPTAGQIWVVVKDAPCKEIGPDASDEPWQLKKGSFVTWLAKEGAMTRVETAPGMPPCLIASDAIAPKSSR
jgi:hypothetical protein